MFLRYIKKFTPGKQNRKNREENIERNIWMKPIKIRWITTISIGIIFLLIFILNGCGRNTSSGQNQAFEKFTKEMFCQETASNTISLHYTLKNPEEYGIKEKEITFGKFETNEENVLASVENLNHVMKKFSYGNLSEKNQLTYDVLDYYFGLVKENAQYLLYDEPLGLVGGIQTQLPVVLSEYAFENREDVEIYLELLKTTPEYFDSLITFEKEKSKAGLFMSEEAAEKVIAQCRAFMDMGESNYLVTTFVERIKQIEELSEKEKSDYIKKNALMLNSYVLPAYGKLTAAVEELKQTGKNKQGLCYLPHGREYYEYVVRAATGSERTVEEIRQLTRAQMADDLSAMEKIAGIHDSGNTAGKVKETVAVQAAAQIPQNPESILKELQGKILTGFPKPPEITYSVKYVPKEMQEHLSPAFYMIPAIDSYEENVIYVNQAQMGNALTLYTTLAHEGYPGHLYQTVYYANTKPNPIRSVMNFGGYVEGWATYAEMCSYYLAPITKEQATVLQKNSSIILGLYTLADIGIHYDGWNRADTFAFFSNYGIRDAEIVNRIYDLILGCPGNYLKYYIGYVEFLELKKEWMEEKGDTFSQKDFHKAVLNVGPAPFSVVKKYAWKEK